MPFGEYQYSMDDKGRVIIPPPFREFVDDGLVITRGMEGCLYIFPLTAWERIERHLTTLPLTDPDSQKFVRFFYSGAAKLKLDSAGRITVPPTLRQFAGIEGPAMVIGTPNRLEVWNETRYYDAITEVQGQPPSPSLLSEMAA